MLEDHINSTRGYHWWMKSESFKVTLGQLPKGGGRDHVFSVIADMLSSSVGVLQDVVITTRRSPGVIYSCKASM